MLPLHFPVRPKQSQCGLSKVYICEWNFNTFKPGCSEAMRPAAVTHRSHLGCAMSSTHKARLSNETPHWNSPDPYPHMSAPTSGRQSAGRREIIHTVSQREAGVLCQPERFTACLLSPAIEVIHRTIMLQVIVQKNTAACCTGTSSPTSPRLPRHSWIIPPESQHQAHRLSIGQDKVGVIKFYYPVRIISSIMI